MYLCVDARLGLRLGVLVLGSDILNNLLKVLFALPRPYWVDPQVRALATESSFGMPSSHAQNSAAVWPYLALMSRRAWVWLIAAFLIVGIGISRIALGVHFAADVVVGWALGALVLVLFLAVAPKVEVWFVRQTSSAQIVVACAVVTVVFLLRFLTHEIWTQSISMFGFAPFAHAAGGDYYRAVTFAGDARSWDAIVARSGALWGILIGAGWMTRVARFSTDGSTGQRLARFIVALIGVIVCWKGLAAIFPKEPETVGLFFRFVRYAILTLWVTWGAPWLLLKWGWLRPARKEVTT
jgi:hypothetical protein